MRLLAQRVYPYLLFSLNRNIEQSIFHAHVSSSVSSAQYWILLFSVSAEDKLPLINTGSNSSGTGG